jgi:EpsI family protein
VTNRRAFLIGAAGVAGAGLAYALKPRRRVSLLPPGVRVDGIVPRAFGDWVSQDVSDLVAPKTEDSLAARLYGETVGRVYTRGRDGAEIMMLLAHGDTQSDDLQLHRPEICYPAFGFAISHSEPLAVRIAGDVSVPSRRLLASAPGRQETIVYWSRLGEFLPTDRKQQQWDRMLTAMHGVIADGLLARFSMIGLDPAACQTVLTTFIAELVLAVAAARRPILIGAGRAAQLAAIRR